MALVIGTNCGFVTEAPAADPDGQIDFAIDTRMGATKDTTPAVPTTITEIGWWCDTATEETNFEVGIYSDGGGDDPVNLLHVSRTNAKGTTAGWKRVTGLNFELTAETIYWIAVQVDDTTTASNSQYANTGGPGFAYDTSETTLKTPWTSTSGDVDGKFAVYAVWEGGEPPAGTNMQVNIGDVWKEVPAVQINIGDSWKAVAGMQINIGDVWKTIF